jgi:BTB/POZ domain
MSANPKADVVFESGSPLHRSCVQWKIRYFSAYISEFLAHPADNDRVLQSPDFSTNSGNEWVLSTNFTESLDMKFFIHLESMKEDYSLCPPGMHTELSVIVDGVKHEIQQKLIKEISLKLEHCIWKMKIDDFKKFMEMNLKDDAFCINLEIEEWSDQTFTVTNSHDNDIVKCPPTGNTIINFLTNQNLTDVTFECQGKKLKAHKLILAAASPVFEAMFKEGTKEHHDNYVNIEDIDSDVFEVFLRFLYSGQVDQLDEMCFDLFTAADKYDVQPLRNICIQHMSDNISVDNAVEVLALAERHSIEPTKSLALQFIKANIADVVKTDSWASLLVNHPGNVKRMRAGGSQTEESAGKRQK